MRCAFCGAKDVRLTRDADGDTVCADASRCAWFASRRDRDEVAALRARVAELEREVANWIAAVDQ